jgi:hypothetical protein
VQFLIDTASDKPTELYKIGRWLVEQFECVPVAAQDASEGKKPVLFTDVVAPPSLASLLSDNDDVEVEIDDAGNIQSVAAVVELPAAPPPPPVFNPDHATLGAAAPLPPAIPAPPGAGPAELDSRGYPWDTRIHASNRSKTIKNEWKRKRGIDDNLVTACEAQNKPGNGSAVTAAIPPVAVPLTAMQAESATFGQFAPPPPPAVSSPSTPAVPAFPAPAMAPPPPLPPHANGPSFTVSTPTPAPTTAPTVIDFRGLMQKIQAASAAGKLSAAQVTAALAGVGLRPEEMAQLINNAPLIASVNAAVDACLS